MKRVIALFLSFAMAFSVPFAANAAEGDPGEIAHPDVVDGGDPAAAIAAAKAADPEGFAHKVNLLRSSDALMALFKGAPDAETVTFYLEFYAMQSSVETVQAFVDNTAGKHFVVTGTKENPSVRLQDGASLVKKDCCACWQAWVASAAYMVGSGLICTAVGVGGGAISGGVGAVAGFTCGGVFWAIEKLPDFNRACR